MEAVLTITIIILFFLTTFYTLRNPYQFEKYLFRVDDILIRNEYYRILTSGFLHVNWMHFGFNAFSLFVFGEVIEASLPIHSYLILYVGSLIGGNLLALFIHRQHGDYSAVGASGAISGVIFAFTFLYPDAELMLILIPIPINAVIFCFTYTLISMYGIQRQKSIIGHEAHLGGAVTGLCLAGILQPGLIQVHWDTFLILALPTAIFLLLITLKPEILLIDRFSTYRVRKMRESNITSVKRVDPSTDIDRILDKINEHGMESLTRKERRRLERDEE